jgi:hypothetical protein
MKKKWDFDQLSNVQCMEPGCEKYLKRRLVEAKFPRNITHCYKHQPKGTISGHSERGRS